MTPRRLVPAATLSLALAFGAVPPLHAQATPRPMSVMDLNPAVCAGLGAP